MTGSGRKRAQGRNADGDGSDASSNPLRGNRLQPAGYDGPASQGTGSAGRGNSNPPSVASPPLSPTASQGGFPSTTGQPVSRRTSMSGAQPAAGGQLRLQGDPARDVQKIQDPLRDVDMPASYYAARDPTQLPTDFKSRPGYNTSGKSIQLALNAWPVVAYPTANVFQYDVVIGNGTEKRMVENKVWESKQRIQATGPQIIFDGHKLAWSTKDMKELRLMIDLDAEEGQTGRGDKNTFRLRITPARNAQGGHGKKVDVSVIRSYLEGKIQMNNDILEAMNFLDHLLRHGPAHNPAFVNFKRSYFARAGTRADIGQGVEAFRGVYQAIRLAEGKKLIVNLDVSNTCFWKPHSLTSVMATNKNLRDPNHIATEFQNTEFRINMSKWFKKIGVKAVYKGNPLPDKEWKIESFLKNSAKEEMMEWKDLKTKQPTGEKVSIQTYFKRKYNLTLQYPHLPLVVMTKKDVKYPMELIHILPCQRYTTKLSDVQTANMIKFAVSPPRDRLAAIEEGKGAIGWQNDKWLNEFGLKIDQNSIKTSARLLPPPGVKYANQTEQPGTKGRWDLRGKKFLTPNSTELVSWGVGIFPGRAKLDKAGVEKFANDFIRAYRGHGGLVKNGLPHIMQLPQDAGDAAYQLHQATGSKFNKRPQLLIFLVQDKQSFHYLRIKKSCDCRFGVVSQVMQLNHVIRGSPQYYSNVLMKVNAKLGGCTSQSVKHAGSQFRPFAVPTMIIGADVSHASPGSMQPSMAAITVSFDRHCGRYAAACQTNGQRVEMISPENMRSMFAPLLKEWKAKVGSGNLPAQIFYIRDGVAAGQYAQVMNEEVPKIKEILTKENKDTSWNGKLTVIIASKRHHVRAFPQMGGDAADQKGNPLPGCVIERDVTMANEFDFYMYSHIALQGTSRPVHYTIIRDDANHGADYLQSMLYEHCYQYMRSTTSVSLHPAVYYAHLASLRAKSHEDIPASSGPQAGPGFKMNNPQPERPDSEPKALLPMYDATGINYAMWYI